MTVKYPSSVALKQRLNSDCLDVLEHSKPAAIQCIEFSAQKSFLEDSVVWPSSIVCSGATIVTCTSYCLCHLHEHERVREQLPPLFFDSPVAAQVGLIDLRLCTPLLN